MSLEEGELILPCTKIFFFPQTKFKPLTSTPKYTLQSQLTSMALIQSTPPSQTWTQTKLTTLWYHNELP